MIYLKHLTPYLEHRWHMYPLQLSLAKSNWKPKITWLRQYKNISLSYSEGSHELFCLILHHSQDGLFSPLYQITVQASTFMFTFSSTAKKSVLGRTFLRSHIHHLLSNTTGPNLTSSATSSRRPKTQSLFQIVMCPTKTEGHIVSSFTTRVKEPLHRIGHFMSINASVKDYIGKWNCRST